MDNFIKINNTHIDLKEDIILFIENILFAHIFSHIKIRIILFFINNPKIVIIALIFHYLIILFFLNQMKDFYNIILSSKFLNNLIYFNLAL